MGHVARDIGEASSFDRLGSREKAEVARKRRSGRSRNGRRHRFLARFVCHFIHDSADHVSSIHLTPLAPRPLPLFSPSRVEPWYKVAERSFRTLFR